MVLPTVYLFEQYWHKIRLHCFKFGERRAANCSSITFVIQILIGERYKNHMLSNSREQCSANYPRFIRKRSLRSRAQLVSDRKLSQTSRIRWPPSCSSSSPWPWPAPTPGPAAPPSAEWTGPNTDPTPPSSPCELQFTNILQEKGAKKWLECPGK